MAVEAEKLSIKDLLNLVNELHKYKERVHITKKFLRGICFKMSHDP